MAAATARTNAAQQSKAEHAQALEGFTSENPNWTHRYGMVSFDDVIVDPAVQRPEQPGEIAAIVRDYNPLALGTVTISRRVVPAIGPGVVCALCGQDGSKEHVEMVLIDGQQRRRASQIVGYSGQVHADVHDGLTPADEATLFRQLNFRKAISPVVLFRNALREGNANALAVQAILDGLKIPFGTAKGYMAAKGAVALVQRKNGVTNLEWALRQVQRLYDRGQGGVYEGAVVEAFFLLYERYGNRIDEKRLFEQLASDEGTTAALVEFARSLRRIKKG
ncbi:MAG TPA: hypothetical protein VFD73_01100, partial [Gemmatimonadales bacterium]|nr:hypothetical protein [Gemmatimonadales bacterium]